MTETGTETGTGTGTGTGAEGLTLAARDTLDSGLLEYQDGRCYNMTRRKD